MSETDPLRIGLVDAPGGGRIDLTLRPGKRMPHALSGPWDRDLDADRDVGRDAGAVALVALAKADEMAAVDVPPERLGPIDAVAAGGRS